MKFKMKEFTIRKDIGVKGKPNKVYQTIILAKTSKAAEKLAKKENNYYWKLVDSCYVVDKDYVLIYSLD